MGLLATIGVSLGVRNQITAAQARITANERPLATMVAASRTRVVEPSDSKSQYELPKPVEPPLVETPPQLNYDLDHGRPMPPDLRDTKSTY